MRVLADTREHPPTEATRVERSPRRGPRAGIAVAVVAVLVAGGIFFATRGKGPLAGVIPGTSKSPALVTPDFHFRGAKTVAIPTVASQSPKKLKEPAQQAALQTTSVIHDLYTEAFLDPANWQGGTYDSAYAVFSSSAASQAESSADVLTAGPRAGDAFSDIQPGKAKIQSQVLMDARGNPSTVVATVTFTARGTQTDGPTTLFVSSGSFFLRRVDGDWKIVAFQVRRGDKVEKTPVTPSGSSGSTTPSGSPS
jgi:hypothetical protein